MGKLFYGFSWARYCQYRRISKSVESWIAGRKYLEGDTNMDDVSSQLGVPRDILSSYFLDRYGVSFLNWRKELRIQEAFRIISSHPEYSLDCVASMVGICDKSNFKRQFKDVAGVSPVEWRRTHCCVCEKEKLSL